MGALGEPWQMSLRNPGTSLWASVWFSFSLKRRSVSHSPLPDSVSKCVPQEEAMGARPLSQGWLAAGRVVLRRLLLESGLWFGFC